MAITTIKIDDKTKIRIEKLRVYKRETYDEIVQKILDILNLCRLNPERAKAKLVSIDRARRRTKEVKGPVSQQSQSPQRSPQT